MTKKTMVTVQGNKQMIPDGVPVCQDLTSQMLIDVAVNEDSQVWVFHDQPFPAVLEWVEYDVDEARLVFVTKGGALNDLGITIEPLMQENLVKARTVSVYLIQDRQINDFSEVQLIVKQYESVH